MWAFLDQLRSWQLFVLTLGLFLADLVVPDPVPWLDELVLGALALALSRWRKTRAR